MPSTKVTSTSQDLYPKLLTIAISAIIGALVGLGVYQAAYKGYLPVNKNTGINPVTTQRIETITKGDNTVADIVDNVSPSVVAIGGISTQNTFNPFDPFSAPRSSQSDTIGTGFVVANNGVIITNKHVVADTSMQYTIVTKDGKKYSVSKIYRDPILDLAIIQLSGGNLKSLTLGDSSKLRVGQSVIAIGNALGQFTNTVTTGIVSGLGRRVVAGDPFSGSSESLDDLIQTDAAINPGNSGGPLLDASGNVIGVNVATTQGAQNIGFAIPINDVKKIVNEFITTGKVSRPFLGVSYQFITRDLAIMEQIPQGAYVRDVIDGSAASKAGINQGDIITKIDNTAIDSESKVSEIIAAHKIGDSLSITVWTNGNSRQVTATLEESPNQ